MFIAGHLKEFRGPLTARGLKTSDPGYHSVDISKYLLRLFWHKPFDFSEKI